MESFASIEIQLVALFLGIGAGVVARLTRFMNDDFDAKLSKLLLNITLPCLIVSSVLLNENLPDAGTIAFVFLLSCISYAITLVLAFAVPWVLRFPVDVRGVYSFMIAFGNVGFIGFPVLSAIFGTEVLLYTAIFNIPFNILVFTVGVFMISPQQGSLRERLRECSKHLISPTLIACFVAMVLGMLRITETGILGQGLSTVGSMTTPAALLIIGSSLAKMPVREMLLSTRPYVAVVCRLLVLPVFLFFILRPFITDPMILGAVVITAGMPVATNGTLLCLQYGGDLETITKGTFISTLLSMISIPLIATLVLSV